ncbi:hypothetical protein C2G38_2222288 [Gigaspora rosea]|uniref:Uncharacterized protein n=1 Tax=Gigaspora rosea TaxID=44941 RepID=A0A397U6T7_9GLOM|nr:hypothetical protein C2G38_2222288 [Gigaspora rosea]
MPGMITVLSYITKHYTSKELNLPSYDIENVVIVTGKFRSIEYINEKDEKASTLKIILNDLVHLNIKPENLPEFPILVNMTAVAEEPPTIGDDITMTVTMHDHVDQAFVQIPMKCYYSATAPHLTRITEFIKKDSVLYINGELILYDNTNYVHVKSISFPDSQKKKIGMSVSVKPLWESESSDKTNKTSIAQTIAEKVKNNTKRTRGSSPPKVSSPKITSTKVSPSPKVSSSSKALSSSKTSSPPSKRTRNSCKVSDLAKEALTNPDRLDTSSVVSVNFQTE